MFGDRIWREDKGLRVEIIGYLGRSTTRVSNPPPFLSLGPVCSNQETVSLTPVDFSSLLRLSDLISHVREKIITKTQTDRPMDGWYVVYDWSCVFAQDVEREEVWDLGYCRARGVPVAVFVLLPWRRGGDYCV